MTDHATLILASTSPHRRALLGRLGLPFVAVAPPVEETERPGEPPADRALRLAAAKAASIAAQHPEAVVIGSDQVASLALPGQDLQLLHKPGNRPTCRAQLRAMSGQVVRFDTAVAVYHHGTAVTHLEPTLVHFRDLEDADIERYMDHEPAFDCAGGFKCEGLGVSLFRAIESRDPTALVGLPLIFLCEALRHEGIPI